MVSLCLFVLLAIASSCSAQRREIGTLPTFQHRVSGTLYAEGDHTFIVENFNYDGFGPTVYIYVYEKGVTVSSSGNGIILQPQGAASNGRLTRSYTNEELVVRLADCTGCRAGLTIRDLHSFTVWCQAFRVFFTRRDIPADLFDQAGDDVLAPPSTYDNCESLNEELQVSWTVDQMKDRIFLQLCGCVDETDYMAFGISGSDAAVQMVGADAVVTWHDTEGTGAVDYYLSAQAQCRPNVENGPKGACPDEVQGGTSNTTALRGGRESNGRCVEYVRPLSASDATLDRAITPSSAQYIVWATGPRGTVDGFAYFHTSYPSNLQTTLQFGRTAADNCAALSCPTPPSCPYTENTFDVTNRNATFVAEIGLSGGPRGYEGITGRSGWGIAWYLNSTLIPVIKATRGNTYTFIVYGGDNSSDAGKYHPFYISDSIGGGRLANTPQERAAETVYAGFDGDTASAIGTLCEHQSTASSGPTAENCAMTFQDYFATLSRSCASTGEPQPGTLVWTPDENTPDTVYYQCATHVNLGWKLEINNPVPQPSSTTTTESTSFTQPTESASSSLAIESKSSSQASESASSSQASERASSTRPIVSTSSTQPSESTSSTQPSESTSSTQPSESTSSTQPSESTSSTRPTENTSSPLPGESSAPPLRTSEAPSPTNIGQPAGSHAVSYYSSFGAVSALLTALCYLFLALL